MLSAFYLQVIPLNNAATLLYIFKISELRVFGEIFIHTVKMVCLLIWEKINDQNFRSIRLATQKLERNLFFIYEAADFYLRENRFL